MQLKNLMPGGRLRLVKGVMPPQGSHRLSTAFVTCLGVLHRLFGVFADALRAGWVSSSLCGRCFV